MVCLREAIRIVKHSRKKQTKRTHSSSRSNKQTQKEICTYILAPFVKFLPSL